MMRNSEAAKILYIALLEASRDLSDAVAQVWDYLDEHEQTRCKIAVGKMLAEIYQSGIAEIEQLYPSFENADLAREYEVGPSQ
ncbi:MULTISPECIES: hypothetical protein [unclassified Caballeronia]|uniref:hypothetical protein n=1 Tax=unclassified Caballeronia TaxID=2646786 RepID=UPI0028568939|nr:MULTISPECIES: hypothetical protein [unclassified Caballeronia]MDR5771687.1 hypothetical protein [Caballeronia sp. LZ002]MDR5805482.1 hypothetical protein [Caballeronia sp. LZ001]MDR5847122.1 hypothetical protein [Caballeronia sp. LZ003]